LAVRREKGEHQKNCKALHLRHNLNNFLSLPRVLSLSHFPLFDPHPSMSATATLCDLADGATAVIQDIPAGHDEHITRLRELGLVPGTKVRLVRRAPLGDPLEVAVRGSRLAMRRSEARHIRVIHEA
jgi:Fe2+ transport system protein FeoA